MKPDTVREATGTHLIGSSGWLEAARGHRSVKEPGKPSWEAQANAERESITVSGPEGGGEARSSAEAK